MAKSLVHVNRQNIAMNVKDGGNRPVWIVRQGSKTTYARGVTLEGPVTCVQSETALRCGARAWTETEGEVTMIDPMTFAESRNVAA